MYYYAQLNADNVAVGVSQLSGAVDNPQLIPLETYDADVMGKKWNGSTWEAMPEPEPVPPEPTPEELNTMALMEGIAGLYESQIALEDRIATDNLTVMEGIAGLFEAQMGGM